MTSRRELNEFIELPFRLHSSHPAWVPPLRLERHAVPVAAHERVLHARRGARTSSPGATGASSGRISAQVDHAFNAYHGSRWGWFGFLEIEDDPEAFAALLDAAEAWLRARGLRQARRARRTSR